jgi:hypothetical protein
MFWERRLMTALWATAIRLLQSVKFAVYTWCHIFTLILNFYNPPGANLIQSLVYVSLWQKGWENQFLETSCSTDVSFNLAVHSLRRGNRSRLLASSCRRISHFPVIWYVQGKNVSDEFSILTNYLMHTWININVWQWYVSSYTVFEIILERCT